MVEAKRFEELLDRFEGLVNKLEGGAGATTGSGSGTSMHGKLIRDYEGEVLSGVKALQDAAKAHGNPLAVDLANIFIKAIYG